MGPEEEEEEERQQPPAALAFWAAAAAARGWSAFIREHAACVHRRGAWSAEDGANADIKRAVEGCERVPDAHGRPGADAMGPVTDAMRRAAEAMDRAAGGYGRSSKLYGEAAAEAARSYRAFRRAGDDESAGVVRSANARARRAARDAAEQAAAASELAGALVREAGRLDGCAAEWALSEGGRGEPIDVRGLTLALSDTWEDAKRSCLESAMVIEKADELERTMARARRTAAAAAREAADEAGAAAAASAAAAAAAAAEDGSGNNGDGRGRRGCQEEEEERAAAAAWRRAMAAANRADAEHPVPGWRTA